MRARRDREDQAILADRSAARLTREPVRRDVVARANAALPEDVHPLLPARSSAERQRDEPERFPEAIGLDILRAPAAEQATPVCRAIEHRLDQRRADQAAL